MCSELKPLRDCAKRVNKVVNKVENAAWRDLNHGWLFAIDSLVDIGVWKRTGMGVRPYDLRGRR